MDKTIEIDGRTLEEAIQIAAKELGVSIDAVEYAVIEEGARGFLGLGQPPTKIKAWLREGYVPTVAPDAAADDKDKAQQVADIEDEQTLRDGLMQILTDILAAMNLPAKPIIKSIEGEEVNVDVEGGDVGILIGRQGQTIDALQYLLSIAVNRASKIRWRINLDAGGYRDRHRRLLETKAREYADAVRKHGQEAELEPQSPRDRRIIHLALADNPHVYTYSEGEGSNRHVVISPKK
ncbi:MAG: KH domain-containing protein [Armatimonadetes bacterium]|nr:KH domain-containing protein [Armatimonadota bacterium]